MKLLNTAEDMKWLREVHLRNLDAKFHSAVMVGSEDSPERVDVYEQTNPQLMDKGITFLRTRDNVLREPECEACHVKGELHMIGGAWLSLTHADSGYSVDITGEGVPKGDWIVDG